MSIKRKWQGNFGVSSNTFNLFHNMTGVTFLEPRPAIFIVN
jgi:hypothetical protein